MGRPIPELSNCWTALPVNTFQVDLCIRSFFFHYKQKLATFIVSSFIAIKSSHIDIVIWHIIRYNWAHNVLTKYVAES